ncbi:hypothetical protein V8C37DRAFT_414996 [Trichoderma ceciliae]
MSWLPAKSPLDDDDDADADADDGITTLVLINETKIEHVAVSAPVGLVLSAWRLQERQQPFIFSKEAKRRPGKGPGRPSDPQTLGSPTASGAMLGILKLAWIARNRRRGALLLPGPRTQSSPPVWDKFPVRGHRTASDRPPFDRRPSPYLFILASQQDAISALVVWAQSGLAICSEEGGMDSSPLRGYHPKAAQALVSRLQSTTHDAPSGGLHRLNRHDTHKMPMAMFTDTAFSSTPRSLIHLNPRPLGPLTTTLVGLPSLPS